MAQIITNMAIEDLKIVGKDVEEGDVANVEEEDFAALHALFESEYQQLLKDIDDEIAKRSQKQLG